MNHERLWVSSCFGFSIVKLIIPFYLDTSCTNKKRFWNLKISKGIFKMIMEIMNCMTLFKQLWPVLFQTSPYLDSLIKSFEKQRNPFVNHQDVFRKKATVLTCFRWKVFAVIVKSTFFKKYLFNTLLLSPRSASDAVACNWKRIGRSPKPQVLYTLLKHKLLFMPW